MAQAVSTKKRETTKKASTGVASVTTTEDTELDVDDDVVIVEAAVVTRVIPNYGDRNRELFRARGKVIIELEELEEIQSRRSSRGRADTKIGRRDSTKIRSLQAALDAVTTEIVNLNRGLVRSYVSKFTSHTSVEDSADFEGAGLVGLMRAISTYDPEQGPFAQWAYRPIKREVLRSVRDADHPNMNPGDFERRPDILRAAAKLSGDDGDKRVSDQEVAVEAGVTVDQVQRVLHAPHLGSLSSPVGGEDGDTSLGDMIPENGPDPLDTVMSALSITALEAYGLSALEPRELFVIVRRFGLDGEPSQRLSSIGTKLGLSREAARQIESKALAKLSHPVVLRKLVRHNP